MKVTLLPPKKQNGFCVDVTLSHTHNHAVDIADGLRFRPISECTKEKYYDFFRQGHSPASAHLEYEIYLTYKEEPNLIADRSNNLKLIYNLFDKWRKSNISVRSGKQLFTELETKGVSMFTMMLMEKLVEKQLFRSTIRPKTKIQIMMREWINH